MESSIVTTYKNKGIITPELISLPFVLRSSNICFKKLFFRQIFLKGIYFSSCKIPENQESASLDGSKQSYAAYWLHNVAACIQKVLIAKYICITGVASQQGTLTLPDTWFRPPFWDLLMLQLLRPNSSNLPCLYSTFHLEYPLVLSRFYLYMINIV